MTQVVLNECRVQEFLLEHFEKQKAKQKTVNEEFLENLATRFVSRLLPPNGNGSNGHKPFVNPLQLKIVVHPGQRQDSYVVFLNENGYYKEVKIQHKLQQLLQAEALEWLTYVLGLPEEKAKELLFEHIDIAAIDKIAKKLVRFAKERQEIDWQSFAGKDIIFLDDGSLIEVSEEGIFRYQEHGYHNLFAIPSTLEDKEPSFFLELIRERFEEGTEAFLDLLALLLSPTDENKILTFLYGDSNTGKSTILDVLEVVFGKNAVAAHNLDLISGSGFHLKSFADKLIIFSHEARKDVVDDAALKAIASRERILIDQKFKEAFEAKVVARLIVATNVLPLVKAEDDALVKRVWLFKINKKLQKKIRRSKIIAHIRKEAAAIRWFLIKRLYTIHKKGLHPETKRYLKKTRKLFTLETNPVAAFWVCFLKGEIEIPDKEGNNVPALETKAVLKEENATFVRSKFAYKVYRSFCEEFGFQPLSIRNFATASRSLPEELGIRITGPALKRFPHLNKPKRAYCVTTLASGDVTDVTDEESEALHGNACLSRDVTHVTDVTHSEESFILEGETKSNSKSVTSVTCVTSIDTQGIQCNALNPKTLQSVTEETSPDFFSSRVGDFSPAEEESCVSEVLSLEEAVPLEDEEPYAEAAEEQEEEQAAAEEEEIVEGRDYEYVSPDEIEEFTCVHCVHFPVEAGYRKVGKVCRATGETTWWDRGICKHFIEREDESEEAVQEEKRQKSEVKTEEDLLRKYGDKIKEIVEVLAEAAEAQRKNKKKTKEEELMFLKEFSARHKGEPRCYNCSHAIVKNQKWFCVLHKTFVPGLDLCDGWEPYQLKRPSQEKQTPSQEKQTPSQQQTKREESDMSKERKVSPKRKQATTKATKPAKAKQATKTKVTKQKQAKERRESLQERVNKIAQSAAFYEEIIREGHEKLLEIAFRRAA